MVRIFQQVNRRPPPPDALLPIKPWPTSQPHKNPHHSHQRNRDRRQRQNACNIHPALGPVAIPRNMIHPRLGRRAIVKNVMLHSVVSSRAENPIEVKSTFTLGG